ncbi:MAG: DinB family protein [Anaerolineales bacterium]|nr:DinB family protein [Anaerolineales bacterium]
MTEIKTKTEIISSLKDSRQRVLDWFTAIPEKDFFTRHGEAWSPSDNVDHLIRAHKPITMALKLPKFVLQLIFGKANRPSKSYEALCEKYVNALHNGGRAGGTFLPTQETPEENADERKKKILAQLSKESTKLISAAETWDETALDKYILPHPLIGKLTIREILYFTIYHNLRHATLEGD